MLSLLFGSVSSIAQPNPEQTGRVTLGGHSSQAVGRHACDTAATRKHNKKKKKKSKKQKSKKNKHQKKKHLKKTKARKKNNKSHPLKAKAKAKGKSKKKHKSKLAKSSHSKQRQKLALKPAPRKQSAGVVPTTHKKLDSGNGAPRPTETGYSQRSDRDLRNGPNGELLKLGPKEGLPAQREVHLEF